jgi:hypothetical protein
MSLRRVTREISAQTSRRMSLLVAERVVGRLNRLLIGWGNYFCLGPVTKAYQAVDAHSRYRLRRWLCAKHKHSGAGTTLYPGKYLYEAR